MASEGAFVAKGFRDLLVWQKAMRLSVFVYRITKQFPREELYGLSSQMRRAAVSIPSNIAEGQGRLNLGEFRQFVGIAHGSNCELQTQLEIACQLELCDKAQLGEAIELSEEVGRMLHGLIESFG
jgi:four helix bundle protein